MFFLHFYPLILSFTCSINNMAQVKYVMNSSWLSTFSSLPLFLSSYLIASQPSQCLLGFLPVEKWQHIQLYDGENYKEVQKMSIFLNQWFIFFFFFHDQSTVYTITVGFIAFTIHWNKSTKNRKWKNSSLPDRYEKQTAKSINSLFSFFVRDRNWLIENTVEYKNSTFNKGSRRRAHSSDSGVRDCSSPLLRLFFVPAPL